MMLLAHNGFVCAAQDHLSHGKSDDHKTGGRGYCDFQVAVDGEYSMSVSEQGPRYLKLQLTPLHLCTWYNRLYFLLPTPQE